MLVVGGLLAHKLGGHSLVCLTSQQDGGVLQRKAMVEDALQQLLCPRKTEIITPKALF